MGFIIGLKRLVRGDEGQDLLEYALLVALIALVAVAAITLTGTNVNPIFTNIAAALAPPAALTNVRVLRQWLKRGAAIWPPLVSRKG